MLGRDRVGRPHDSVPASTERQCRFRSCGRARPTGASGLRPPGSAAGAERTCAGAVLVTASAPPGLWPGTQAPGYDRRSGSSHLGRRCLSTWGVGGRCACRRFTRRGVKVVVGDHPATVKSINDFGSH